MKSVQFAAKFEYLDEIRDFVGEIARAGGFSDKDVYNIQLATDEAASNIIEHAYGVSQGEMIEMAAVDKLYKELCSLEYGAEEDRYISFYS